MVRLAPERDGEQPQRPTTMMTGQPSTHTKPISKSDDIGEDKHQGLTVTKNNAHDDDGTNPAPFPMRCLHLTMTPVPR